MVVLPQPTAFEWDAGNAEKNYRVHNVGWAECEEVFFSEQKLLFNCALHLANEERYILLGETKEERKLFIVFTFRKHQIRVISARDLNKKERKLYEQAIKNSQI